MPGAALDIRQILAGFTDLTSRHLLNYIQIIQREKNGGSPPPRLRLPGHPDIQRALGRRIESLDAGKRAEVVDYARYLKVCQRARVSRAPIPANQRVTWWSPTPRKIVIEALNLAETGPRDLLFDLGCGDGRVVVDAARLFGARAVGFDIDAKHVRDARERIKKSGTGNLARVRRQSMLAIPDLYKATLIYLYLTPRALNRVIPIVVRRCRPGTRILSIDTWNRHWPAEKELKLRVYRYKWRVGLWYL
jgi:SAM-dependent methyltransferase